MRNRPITSVSVPDPIPTSPSVSHPIHPLNVNLLLKRISHTNTRPNIDPSIELLAQRITRHVHADDRTRLVAALDTVADAARGIEGRLAARTGRSRDVESVAAGGCCAGAGDASEVPDVLIGEGGCRCAGGEEDNGGGFGEHGDVDFRSKGILEGVGVVCR